MGQREYLVFRYVRFSNYEVWSSSNVRFLSLFSVFSTILHFLFFSLSRRINTPRKWKRIFYSKKASQKHEEKKRLARDLMPSFIIRNSEQPWPQNRSLGSLATYFYAPSGASPCTRELRELHSMVSECSRPIRWEAGNAAAGALLRLRVAFALRATAFLWLTSLPWLTTISDLPASLAGSLNSCTLT